MAEKEGGGGWKGAHIDGEVGQEVTGFVGIFARREFRSRRVGRGFDHTPARGIAKIALATAKGAGGSSGDLPGALISNEPVKMIANARSFYRAKVGRRRSGV